MEIKILPFKKVVQYSTISEIQKDYFEVLKNSSNHFRHQNSCMQIVNEMFPVSQYIWNTRLHFSYWFDWNPLPLTWCSLVSGWNKVRNLSAFLKIWIQLLQWEIQLFWFETYLISDFIFSNLKFPSWSEAYHL